MRRLRTYLVLLLSVQTKKTPTPPLPALRAYLGTCAETGLLMATSMRQVQNPDFERLTWDYAPYIRHLNGEAEPEPEQALEAHKQARPEAQPEAAPTPEPPKPVAVAVAEAPAAPAAPEKKEKKPSEPVKKCPEEVKCPGCGMVFDPFNLMAIAHPAKPIVASAPPPPQQPSKGT
jgi:biotin carboxyl carrier protein